MADAADGRVRRRPAVVAIGPALAIGALVAACSGGGSAASGPRRSTPAPSPTGSAVSFWPGYQASDVAVRTPLELADVVSTRAGGSCGGREVPASDGTSCYRLGTDVLPVKQLSAVTVTDAPQPGQPDRSVVGLALGPADTARFQQQTDRLIGRQLAIVLGGRVLDAPVIQTTIPSGVFQVARPTRNETMAIARAVAG